MTGPDGELRATIRPDTGRPALSPPPVGAQHRPMVDIASSVGCSPIGSPPALGPSSRRRLLEMARNAVGAALGGSPAVIDERDLPTDLAVPAGAFVTIRRGDELRACMGRLDPDTPLWMNVLGAAEGAAGSDRRFEPIRSSEVPHLRLEVSVLGPFAPLEGPAGFRPGSHGVMIERGWQRGLLLPQVATEQGWGANEMLEAVCWKAGLPADAWRWPGTRLSVFQALVISEPIEPPTSADDPPPI
jgi:AmmeMemoRadiSam system protein A